MSFTPFVLVWAVLAIAVLILMVRRTMLGFNEDDSLHLPANEIAAEKQQIAKGQEIDTVDKWGKALTAATAVYGLVLVAIYSYRALY